MEWGLDLARGIVETLGIPLALALAYKLLDVLQQHGYKSTYASAVLKAVGEGQLQAQAAGLSLFSPAGRATAVAAGAKYLMATVPDAGKALGIVDELDHAARVATQIGLLQATAEAAKQPPVARIAGDTIPVPTTVGGIPGA